MWILALFAVGGALYALTQSGTSRVDPRVEKAYEYMTAQLQKAGVKWGVFERSKQVSVLARGFDAWDLLQGTSKETAKTVLDALTAHAMQESPGAPVELRLLGLDDAGKVIADAVTTSAPVVAGNHYDRSGNYRRR